MSEIVCPSCNAKFRVPDSAIGPEGRRVHCSKCGEIWLARPPGVAAPAHETGPQRALPAGGTADTAPSGAEAEPGGGGMAPAASDGGRGAEDAPREAPPAMHEAEPEDELGPEPEAVPQPEPAPEPTWRRILAAERAGGTETAGDGAERVEPTVAPAAAAAGAAAAGVAAGAAAGAATGPAGAASAEREAQMAEIRRMLDELQSPRSGGGTAPAPAPAQPAAAGVSGFTPAGTPAAPQPKPAPRRPDPVVEETYHDPLREKLLQHDSRGKAAAQGSGRANYDASRLAKRHARRHRRRMIAEEQRNSSSALTTGMMLVAMVVCSMALIYAFSDEIVARVPQSAPAMNDYVAVIDGWRAVAGEEYAKIREKVDRVIEESM